MKGLSLLFAIPILFACNNSKKEEKKPGPVTNSGTTITHMPGVSSASFTVEGKEINVIGSLLVTKDKKNLQPGADYFAMLTASRGPNNEGLTLNFLLTLNPGTYPVVGMAFHRGPSGQGEVYGGLLGGEPKLTNYKVNITECKDLGSNNMGGHKWSLSGNFDELVIPAMGVMLLDKTKNHPKEVKIEKGSFTHLLFDDNWEEMMQGAKKKLDEMRGK